MVNAAMRACSCCKRGGRCGGCAGCEKKFVARELVLKWRSNSNVVRRRCYDASYYHLNSRGTLTYRSDTRRCGATRLDCVMLPVSSPTLPWFPPLYLRPPCPASISSPPLHHDNWRTYAYPLSNIHDAPSSSLILRKPFI